ncbi:sulfotransferase family 2 domain-containing protein [Microbulbifer thermotolerans]|uniref:sulfotransferase family 2 domain-containing protein n=1 Tax=Microbulbifer thermotolerans TaxID=252514 RepID=UPI00224B4C2A|nr:sulfotransferase family 2 domain-containing protein [Microbulbifer thermotolerans]MCX2780154.1 sulfotransferase family protein [Microbulbifer thermotolerans]MCX2805578.1 sulfotransferase family protein [Microbulbifer thermotolerans]
MAIINNTHKFIFIHVPKAAGTSITKLFSQYTTFKDLEIGATEFGEKIQSAYKERFGLSKHSTANRIKDIVGSHWESFFKFSFVRNPYSRAFSIYNFLRQWEGCPDKYKLDIRRFSSFEEFVTSGYWDRNPGPDYIFMPQAYWLTDQNDKDQIMVDFVGKVEELDKIVGYIFERISENSHVEEVKVPFLNVSKGPPKINTFSSSVIQCINKKYARDFELFGYEFYS